MSIPALTAALDVAQTVCDDGRPVIIKETSGRDLVFVVATLAQLILDSHYRTIRGFQSLLQRMWVLGGHPFTLRCGHIKMRTMGNREGGERATGITSVPALFRLCLSIDESISISI